MATVVNFIDTTLQAAPFRTVAVAGTTAVDWMGAATTSTWVGTTGAGKPADNATVGATIGTNLSGQFTPANASTFIASGAIAQAMLGAGIIDLTKFASGIEPVTMVTSVPGTKSTYSIFNTTDGKLYRWNGTAYVATVASSDLSGTIVDAQIAALAASKVTGTLTNAQIAALDAAKITGTLSDAQLAAIAAAKITGTLTSAQIADLAATKLTGQIVSTQITDGSIATAKLAANAVTAAKILAGTITSNEIAATTITGANIAGTTITGAKMVAGTVTANEIAALTITAANIAGGTITGAKMVADTITANEIAANAITSSELAAGAVIAGKITAGTIVAADIAANTITAAKIAGATITATELAADSVTAGKIAAAAISAREIAAGAITTDRLAVGDFTNLCDNPDFERGNIGWTLSGVTIINNTSNPRTGVWCAMAGSSVSSGTIRNNQLVSVVQGDVFYARAWLNSYTGADTGFVRITGYTKTGAEIGIGGSSNSATSGWAMVSCIGTIPSGVITARVEVVINTSASGGMDVDSVGFFRMAGATLIQDGAITTNKILAGAVTANEIAANTITAAKIASGTITATEIATGAITSTKINVASLDAVSSVLGSVEISTTGSLRSGQTAYNTGNGFWAGLVSGTAKFSVGNSAGSNIRWDGSTLTVSGQIIGNGNLTTGAAHTADVFSSSFTTTVPFVMPRTGTVIIKARVNPAAGDTAGLKLYNEGSVGFPGTVAATSEHYEAGLGTTAVDVWISQPLTAGNYWLGPSNASYAVLSAFVIKVLA